MRKLVIAAVPAVALAVGHAGPASALIFANGGGENGVNVNGGGDNGQGGQGASVSGSAGAVVISIELPAQVAR